MASDRPPRSAARSAVSYDRGSLRRCAGLRFSVPEGTLLEVPVAVNDLQLRQDDAPNLFLRKTDATLGCHSWPFSQDTATRNSMAVHTRVTRNPKGAKSHPLRPAVGYRKREWYAKTSLTVVTR